MPGAGTTWVWERDHITFYARKLDPVLLSDNVDQLSHTGKKLRDGEFTDWQDELWLENLELAPQPVGTDSDLRLVRHAIAATAFGFPWETSAHGGDVNPLAERLFINPASLLEPAEQGLTCSPSEGSL